MSVPLNTAQLCQEVGVKRLTVIRWVKKGLPCTRQKGGKGGRPEMIFDRETALQWGAANASLTASVKAKALNRQPNGEPDVHSSTESPTQNSFSQGSSSPAVDTSENTKSKREPVRINPEIAREPGLLGNLERLKAQEYHTSAQLSLAKQANNAGLIVVLSERHLHESKTLAALEQAALNYRIRMGELGPRAEMQSVFERVIVSVKNAILGLPSSVMPLLIPYLREPEKAHEVRTIIDKACRDSLHTASERHTRRS